MENNHSSSLVKQSGIAHSLGGLLDCVGFAVSMSCYITEGISQPFKESTLHTQRSSIAIRTAVPDMDAAGGTYLTDVLLMCS